MRLLQIDAAAKLSLTKDFGDGLPPYAILSHTWGHDEDELDIEDVRSGTYRNKIGFEKVRFCGQQAKKDGIDYFWVDTCCIDKTSSAELSEAINSMFRWYQGAVKCYVYLADVSAQKRDHPGDDAVNWKSAFRTSRWFTRGWTLQELLAPRIVEFFSREQKHLGSKAELHSLIESITSIPTLALLGASLTKFTVEQKWTWASKRVTKKVEDSSYCLLGIFGIHLPYIYGEGSEAKRRLKDEIAKAYRVRLDAVDSNQGYFDQAPADVDQAGRRAALLATLDFDEMESRKATIKKAHTATCKWFLIHPAYMSWIDDRVEHGRSSFLWLKGNPGTGKSTLVKFAHAHSNSHRKTNEIVLSFFFNARGDELERSTTGMFRSLLSQLFKEGVDLQDVLHQFSMRFGEDLGTPTWTITSLQDLMHLVLSKLGDRRLTCYIDALDECNEKEVRDMITFFEDIVEESVESDRNLHICFASRHYPSITIRRGTELTLEKEPGHIEDVAKYTQSRLQINAGALFERVKTRILNKANGVFMWAVLVIDILNDECRRGRTFNVEKRLEEIPPELGKLFKSILRRDNTNMEDLLRSLQWVLFAKRPLSVKEFYSAMLSGISRRHVLDFDSTHTTPEDMARFARDSTKGLAEPTKAKVPTVQFIHESVRDFLLKEDGLHDLWPELASNMIGLSHDTLKECCLQYWMTTQTAEAFAAPTWESLPKASTDEAKVLREEIAMRFPFIDYAVNNVWYHADEAAATIAQQDFLTDFPLERWILTSNTLMVHQIRRRTPEASLAYILAETGCSRLIDCALKHLPSFSRNAKGERYQYPLFAALVNKHFDAVLALLRPDQVPLDEEIVRGLHLSRGLNLTLNKPQLLCAVLDRGDRFAEAFIKYLPEECCGVWLEHPMLLFTIVQKDFRRTISALQAIYEQSSRRVHELRQHILSKAVWCGTIDIVDLMLDSGADINHIDVDGRTPLMDACGRKNNAMVQHLIDRGSILSSPMFDVGRALLEAAVNGNTTILQILLNDGAHVDKIDRIGWSALMYAAAYGQFLAVQLLLDRGAQVNLANLKGEGALIRAVASGKVDVAQLLLDRGAHVDAIDRRGKTALMKAASLRDIDMVRLLLGRGAQIDAVDKNHETAALIAATVKRDQWEMEICAIPIMALLVGQGADVNALNLSGWSMLMKTADRENELAMEWLLKSGASTNIMDTNGWTALKLAAQRRQLGAMKLLLRWGADVDATNRDGLTALMVSMRQGHAEGVKVLLDAAGGVKHGALIESVKDYDVEKMKCLLKSGTHERTVSLLNALLLFLVAHHNRDSLRCAVLDLLDSSMEDKLANGLEALNHLLDLGANIDATNFDNETALDLALFSSNFKMIQLLEKRGANGAAPAHFHSQYVEM